jgi:hypothetical protein
LIKIISPTYSHDGGKENSNKQVAGRLAACLLFTQALSLQRDSTHEFKNIIYFFNILFVNKAKRENTSMTAGNYNYLTSIKNNFSWQHGH